jgi:bacillithiol biosynthesis cysteine-adding enzyme BshC
VIRLVDASTVYPDAKFFLDYVALRANALSFFEHEPSAFASVAATRTKRDDPRADVCDALQAYNAKLNAPPEVRASIDALRDGSTLCVVAGQQAGFLGGQAYTAYKILSAIRLADWLEDHVGTRVVPVFWLATEDHDFGEINRVRLLQPDGRLQTVSFEWDERGRPIEALPITPEIARATDEALSTLPDAFGPVRDLFRPASEDDYGTWHARIWSRLFGPNGLIVVEPRVLRHLAGGFFHTTLTNANEVNRRLERIANRLREEGYDPPLDPRRAGRLFHLDAAGRRIRVMKPEEHLATAVHSPDGYSPDAALRPLFTDALLPTLANVVGPAELAYHAMLLPLYQLFGIPQPSLVARHGYTILSAAEGELFERLELTVEDALAPGFDVKRAMDQSVSPELRTAFDDVREAARAALDPLLPVLTNLDRGLEARWRQTADHVDREIDRLKERAVRVDLARRSIPVQAARALEATLRPTGRPQERALSLIHFVRAFAVEWISRLPGRENPERFAHYVVVVRGDR